MYLLTLSYNYWLKSHQDFEAVKKLTLNVFKCVFHVRPGTELTPSFSLSLSLSLSLYLSLSLTHTHIMSLHPCGLASIKTHLHMASIKSPFLNWIWTNSMLRTLLMHAKKFSNFKNSLSLTHTHTHTHSLSHLHTYTLSVSLSLTHTHTHTHLHTCSQNFVKPFENLGDRFGVIKVVQ